MPTTNYKVVNTELDTLFEPLGSGTKIADVGYKVNSVDISNYYRNVADGTQYGQTGYRSNGGVEADIGFKFAALGTVSTVVNGTLFATGLNNRGQLGDGTTLNRSSPVSIGAGCWKSVTGGFDHTLGLTNTSLLFAWGCNQLGQIGDGTTLNRSSPVQIGASSWTAIADNGVIHSAAIRTDGTLFTWGVGRQDGGGSEIHHNLGGGGTVSRCSPVQISSGCFTQVVLWCDGGYAVCCDGNLYAWGWNNPASGKNINVTGVLTPIRTWREASRGLRHGYAIDNDYKLYTWGYGQFGNLGLGVATSVCGCQWNLNQVGASSWVLLGGISRCNNTVCFGSSVGANRTFAINSTYRLFGWGINTCGALGNNSTVCACSPVLVTGTSSWIAIGSGDRHNLALTSVNALRAWGDGTCGGIGNSSTASQSNPLAIGTSSWVAVASGDRFSLAIRSGGGLFTWGFGCCGVLGSGATTNRSSPVQVGASSWIGVSAGQRSSFAIRSDYGLFSWGAGTCGALASGATTNRSSPVQVGTSSWIAVTGGNNCATLLLTSDNRLFFSGLGTTGLNGQGTTTSYSSPIQIGSSSWIAIKAAQDAASAIRSDNCLFTWGSAGRELGRGTSVVTTADYVPCLVGGHKCSFQCSLEKVCFPGNRSVTMVAAGNQGFALAVTTDKLLFAWGCNFNCQLTNIVTDGAYCPVQIGASSWNFVAAGAVTSFARRSDNTLFGWGGNPCGVIGDGTTVLKNSPVQIGTSSWTAVAAHSHTVAVLSTGALFTWGNGPNGELGGGATGTRSSPVQVGSSSFVAVSAGDFTTLLLKKP